MKAHKESVARMALDGIRLVTVSSSCCGSSSRTVKRDQSLEL